MSICAAPTPNRPRGIMSACSAPEIIKSVQSDGRERVDMDLGGVMMFIAKVEPDQTLARKPGHSYVGLDHLGLRVRDIDAVCGELKAKGAEFTVEPKTIRPGVRIAFVRGPQDADRNSRSRRGVKGRRAACRDIGTGTALASLRRRRAPIRGHPRNSRRKPADDDLPTSANRSVRDVL